LALPVEAAPIGLGDYSRSELRAPGLMRCWRPGLICC
jgi:hypothetical protein